MTWINPDSYLLLKTDQAISFVQRNALKTLGNFGGAHFFNQNVLVKVYEERGYLHADYYDLKNLRWKRELENAAVGDGIIPLEQTQELYRKILETSYDDCLKASSMVQFFLYLKIIDTYMQDFLQGNMTRYEKFLQPLSETHKIEIQKFIDKNLSR